MKIEGYVVEIGNLDGGNLRGIRMEAGEEIIEIVGLSIEHIRNMPGNLLFKKATLTLEEA